MSLKILYLFFRKFLPPSELSTQKGRPLSWPGGLLRNVIALFYFVGSENPCIYSVPNRKQSYRYSAPVKGAFLLSQNQVRTRKSVFFKKIEKIFWRGLIFARFRCLPSEGQNNRPREPWKPNTHSTGTFLIGGEGPSRMKVRHELPAHKGYHGKQGW